MRGTLTFLLKPIAKDSASEPNMPSSHTGMAICGWAPTKNQVAPVTASVSPNSSMVLTTTSSSVSRPVCAGPAGAWPYMSRSCWSVRVSLGPGW